MVRPTRRSTRFSRDSQSRLIWRRVVTPPQDAGDFCIVRSCQAKFHQVVLIGFAFCQEGEGELEIIGREH